MTSFRSGWRAVVGATDPPPTALLLGTFYGARVSAADGAVSKPLTGLCGTHVSGGSVLWIIGDYEYMTEQGFSPVGMEPLAVGVSSAADHIITPSKEGPQLAVHKKPGAETSHRALMLSRNCKAFLPLHR